MNDMLQGRANPVDETRLGYYSHTFLVSSLFLEFQSKSMKDVFWVVSKGCPSV